MVTPLHTGEKTARKPSPHIKSVVMSQVDAKLCLATQASEKNPTHTKIYETNNATRKNKQFRAAILQIRNQLTL